MALACVGGIVGFLVLGKAALDGIGNEVATTPVAPGTPFALTFTQGSDKDSRVWLDLDVSYAGALQITGPLAVRVNGTPVAQYNVQIAGGGCSAPVRERTGSFCLNWRHSEVNGSGSLSGDTRLFTVDAQPRGATITVTGMLFTTPGAQVRRLRVHAAQ